MLPQFGDDDLRNIGSVFESAISSLQTILRLRKEIQGMKESAEKTKQQAELKQLLCEYNEKYPFVFKGNETDLSYFLTKQTLPIEKINQLDPPFRDAVKQNFNEMIQQGLVQVDPEKAELSLTPKGKELLDKPEFLERVTRSNIELNEQITKGINQELQERNRYVPGKDKEQIEHEEKELPSKDQAAEKISGKEGDLSKNEKDLLFKDQPMEKEKGNAADLNEKEVISAEQIEDRRAPDQTVFTNEQSVVENVQGSKELSKETLSGEINYNDGVISNQNEMIAEGSKTQKTQTNGGEKPQAARGNQAPQKASGQPAKTTAKAGTKAVKEGTKTATDAGTKVTANTATKATSNVATKATGKAAVKATTKAATKAAATGAKAAISSTGYGAIATAAYEVLSQGVKVTKKITRA